MMMSNLIVPINMAAISYKVAPDASDLGACFGSIFASHRNLLGVRCVPKVAAPLEPPGVRFGGA